MQERFKNFTVLITRINRSIHKIKTAEMAQFNLKSPHVSCLYYLYKSDELTAKELCDVCAEDKASISRSIDYLEKNGYLYCDSDAKKRYRAPLRLTEQGRQTARQIAEKIDGVLAVSDAGLTDEERAIMYRALDAVCKNLEKICDK